ncbi:PAS domain S-box protein [Mucilaginibacter sp. UR6-1]|uniref:PAS domain-containing protein n=1 Tax=Mucilaginibacter sp. UR6-1 TaxID=1435643 RepID=UPI001E62D30C|nr:PAS domain S-box protein [Mucilaginibacter sp. UR6-1]MCC8410366.1 PAS domain S-box protein [Mucilaginibacter sp. UR6-1]
MKVALTPQLLGDLIEKGFTYMLASEVYEPDADRNAPIVLKPIKTTPILQQLPDGYQTYYRITREPMQMCCGISGTQILVDYEVGIYDEPSDTEDVYNDSYFRMSEGFFRQVLDSLEDYAVFTTDNLGNVNSWNTGAQKVLGYTENEVLGYSASIFFTTEDVARSMPAVELGTALREGRAIDERNHVRKDGSKFWGTGLVFPLYDEAHKHRGFTKIMRNLREEKESRESGEI